MTWTYYIDDPDSGSYRQVYPLNARSLKFKRALEDEYIHDWRLSLEGEIILRNDYKNNYLDYDFIKGLETNRRDEIHTFRVFCDGAEHFTGEFSILDCEFDDYKEIVKFKVQPVDDYTYIQENENIEVNIVDIQEKETISAEIYSYWHFYIGSYFNPEVEKDEPYAIDVAYEPIYWNISPYSYVSTVYLHVTEMCMLPSGDTPPSGWTQYADLEDYIIYQRYPVNFPYTWDVNLVWTGKRTGSLYSSVIADSSNYHLLSTNFEYSATSRPDLLCTRLGSTPPYTYNTDYYDPSVVYISDDVYSINANSVTTRYYIGRSLDNVLNRIIDKAFPDFSGQLVSTFLFGDPACIGEYSNPATYYASQGFPTDTKYLIEKSDFLKPFASEAATKGILTWKEAIEYLCIKHNVRWHIDLDGNIRIEHISYYNFSSQGQTITTTVKYKYETADKPNREFFEEDEVWNEDFTKKELVYGTVPILAGSTEKTTSHNLSKFFTDIDGMNTHLDELGDDGFVYVEADEDNAVQTATGFISGDADLQNANLSMANCLNLYHRHNAYQEDFYIEDDAVEAETLKRLKIQEDVEFITDTEVNYKNRLVTSIGEGYIESLEYVPTVEYKYKVNLSYE